MSPLRPQTAAGMAAVLGHLDGFELKGPPQDGLAELHIELTHACNLRCPMCHHWRLKPIPAENLLNAGRLDKLLASTKLLSRIKSVTLTGGEPFLRPDFAAIAAVIRKRLPEAALGVLSNFQSPDLVRRRLLELRTAGIEALWLGSSLDGLGPDHDAMRGVKGAYANLLKTTELLRTEFPHVNFGFNFTLTPGNAEKLFETWLVMSARKLWLGAQLVVNQERLPARRYRWTSQAKASAASQIDKIITHLCCSENAYELLKQGKAGDKPWLWMQLAYWRNLRAYALSPARLFENCGAGRRYAMLSPDGGLFFCPVKKHLLAGNVLKHGFDAAWSSPQAAKLRKRLASKKCHCWLHCTVNPILEQAFGGAL